MAVNVLRPRIFSTFGTTRVVGRQPKAPAAFTPGEIPGTHFQRLSRRQGTWLCWKEPRKKSQVTPPGIDPGTVRANVKVQNIFHGRNNITCGTDCKHRTAATLYTVYRRNVVCFRYIIVNTVHEG